jgi:uncharacterized protein with beta-barrel porin domain
MNFIAGGDSFIEYAVPIAKNAGLGRIGLGWHATKNTTLDVDYEGLFGSGSKDQAAKLSLNVAF